MIEGKTVLALITARGGSKSIPRKNLQEIRGHSLIAWSTIRARQAATLDRLIISTESQEIADEAARFGCEVPFLRPGHLAEDATSSLDVVLHALEAIGERGHDYIVLLQPTSPFRTGSDIDACVRLLHERQSGSVVSISPVKTPPHWIFSLDQDDRLLPLIPADRRPSRRQDAPVFYKMNGAVFAVTPDYLRRHRDFVGPGTVGFPMPDESSPDIDDPVDLAMAIQHAERHGLDPHVTA